jgi:hypothetical protein
MSALNQRALLYITKEALPHLQVAAETATSRLMPDVLPRPTSLSTT